jgi:tetratricopeptide (TPR) repeat protein
VNVASGAEVWGEPYQAPLTDVFRVQADVADRVAVALQTALGGSTGQPTSRVTLANRGDAERVAPAAYDAYLLGRSQWRKRGAPNLRRAATEFQRAIAFDSGFARAWAGYADAVSVLPGYGDTTRTASAARREAEPAARRAIALDPADAQGYVALASVLQNDYDFRGALAALDQAVARDPSDATAHQRRAEVLLALGRLPEAEAAGRRALALDPLAAVVNHALATVLLTAGRDDDEAIRLWRRAVALEPDVPLFRLLLVFAYVEQGRPAEAEAVAREGGDTSRVSRAIRRGLSDPAHRREALAAVAAWRAAVPDRVSGYTGLAWWYARLGVPDSALVMLRRGAAEREPAIPGLLDARSLRGLRTDPRWAEIVREVRGR